MDAMSVAHALMDEYSLRILGGISERAVSRRELSEWLGIPAAACYRRMNKLERLGLVGREEGKYSGNGRPCYRFRSRLRFVRLELEEGQLHLCIATGAESELQSPGQIEAAWTSGSIAETGNRRSQEIRVDS